MAQTMTLSRMASSTVATKAAMAVSGFLLFGFLVGHMVGNLQVFSFLGGREGINAYGHFLHSHPMALWAARLGLLAMLALHVFSAYRLWRKNAEARPIGYHMKKPIKSTYASRTMYWSGPIVLAFLIYHLLHFTIMGLSIPGGGFPLQYRLEDGHMAMDAYKHVVLSFQNIPISLAYIVANLLLGMHLWHGLWSLFQSLGLVNPRFVGATRHFATAMTVLVTGGFLAVPIAVLAGIVTLP